MSDRIFYATGPGNVIQAHRYWAAGGTDPTQVSLTFSSQFEEFCRDIGAKAYIVSSHPQKEVFHDGDFTLEHRPKPVNRRGVRFHISDVLYGFGLLATAVRFKASMAVVDSGCTHYFVLCLFRLAGIKVVAVLHNSLWPVGHPPTQIAARALAGLNFIFFRWGAVATIGVSPECLRQVNLLTHGRTSGLFEFKCQFSPEQFRGIPPPQFERRPFGIMFAGRIVREKGVFDILEIAKRLEAILPGQIRWEICGSGTDLDELRGRCDLMQLDNIVTMRGWTSPRDLRDVYERSHVSIVPTRDAVEGLAMSAVEAVLAGRPVITSAAVPALEVLRPACVEAQTNDIESYVQAVLELVHDRSFYQTLCGACQKISEPFYDRREGFQNVLKFIYQTRLGN